MLIVGTSGRCSIDKSVLQAIPDGAVIVSTSSDQVEIDLKALGRLARSDPTELALGKHEYIIQQPKKPRKKVIVLAEGYPINFYGSESLPNDTIDPIMTLLMLCGVELALDRSRTKRHYKRKILTDEVNTITDKHDLIRQFLRFESHKSV